MMSNGQITPRSARRAHIRDIHGALNESCLECPSFTDASNQPSHRVQQPSHHVQQPSHHVQQSRELLRRSRQLQRGTGPLLVLAPMVRQSDLAFRQLVRRYNVQLCYTPMIPAGWFVQATAAEREAVFQTTRESEGPLVAQLCGNKPEPMTEASRLLASTGAVDAVDINLGCPQSCAERGNYGAFLLERSEWHKVEVMVKAMVSAMMAHQHGVPVWCKIRLLSTLEATIEFALLLQAAGCSLLTVHGRQRHERDHMPPDWEAIGAVRESLSIPVLANGGVKTLADATRCAHISGADGVMVANGLLKNPALALGEELTDRQRLTLAWEYLDMTRLFPPDSEGLGKCIRTHLKYLLGEQLKHFDRAMHFFLENTALCTMWQFEHFLHLAESVMDCGSICKRGATLLTLKQIKVGLYPQTRPLMNDSIHVSP